LQFVLVIFEQVLISDNHLGEVKFVFLIKQ